ncbi:DUF4402 domain-containing protein [Salinimicrobium catena]|uniref:DUF4402 domain-containing protein n=1 Tax=Salinimicrobium catena TaxID=390640 RepID=UPI002FE4713E
MGKNFLILVFFLCSFNSIAQSSTSVQINSRATIIDPLNITNSVDLDFGNVISSFNPGTVILSPDGTRSANGVHISNNFPGHVAPAEAIVKHGNNNYSITLPKSFILYNQNDPNQVLTIDEFTVSPETGEVMDVLKIGATLNLKANQSAGFYTNTSGFNVTVSYN